MKSSLFCRRYRITTITLRTSSATAIDQSHTTHRIFRHLLRQKRWLWTVCRPVCHNFHSFSRDLASSPDLNFCFCFNQNKGHVFRKLSQAWSIRLSSLQTKTRNYDLCRNNQSNDFVCSELSWSWSNICGEWKLILTLLRKSSRDGKREHFRDIIMSWGVTFQVPVASLCSYSTTVRYCSMYKFWNPSTFLNKHLIFLRSLKEIFGGNPVKISDCRALGHGVKESKQQQQKKVYQLRLQPIPSPGIHSLSHSLESQPVFGFPVHRNWAFSLWILDNLLYQLGW